jgi:Domain of unknown function (DUF5602)
MRSMALVVLALAGLAWSKTREPVDPGTVNGARLRYGAPIQLGKGEARTYVLRDEKTGSPVEIGVALTENALQGLPVGGPHGGNGHEHYASYIMELPANHGAPYQFVELDWNPKGHGGPYTAPHFDFHFYRTSLAEHDAIDPARADYAQQAAAFPAADELPEGYVSSHLLMKLDPAQAAVPKMGLHWVDTNSPELPPRNQPFTATFIIGSWGGKVIFDEPMITRDFILAHRDSISGGTTIPVPASTRYAPAGFYMDSYRVSFDRSAGEYRVALTGLAWKE